MWHHIRILNRPIPEKTLINWRTPFMVVLLKPPVKPMTRAHGQFSLRIVQIFNFFWNNYKSVTCFFFFYCMLNYIIIKNYANVSCLPLMTGYLSISRSLIDRKRLKRPMVWQKMSSSVTPERHETGQRCLTRGQGLFKKHCKELNKIYFFIFSFSVFLNAIIILNCFLMFSQKTCTVIKCHENKYKMWYLK